MDFDDPLIRAGTLIILEQHEKGKEEFNANLLKEIEEELSKARGRDLERGWDPPSVLYRVRTLLKNKERSELPEANFMRFKRKHRFQIEISKAQFDRSKFPKFQNKYVFDDDRLLVNFLDSLRLTSLSTERLLDHNAWVRSKHRRFSHAGSVLANAARAQIESTIDKQVFAGKTFQVFRMDDASSTPVTLGSEPQPSSKPRLNFPTRVVIVLLLLYLYKYGIFQFLPYHYTRNIVSMLLSMAPTPVPAATAGGSAAAAPAAAPAGDSAAGDSAAGVVGGSAAAAEQTPPPASTPPPAKPTPTPATAAVPRRKGRTEV